MHDHWYNINNSRPSLLQSVESLNLTTEEFRILDNQVALGKLHNANTVITGSFVEVEGKLRVHAEIMDIKNSRIIATEKIDATDENVVDIIQFLDIVAKNIQQDLIYYVNSPELDQ